MKNSQDKTGGCWICHFWTEGVPVDSIRGYRGTRTAAICGILAIPPKDADPNYLFPSQVEDFRLVSKDKKAVLTDFEFTVPGDHDSSLWCRCKDYLPPLNCAVRPYPILSKEIV